MAKMIKLRCKVPNTEAIESGSAKWRCRTSDPLWAGPWQWGSGLCVTGWGWVAENGGCIAGRAHPREKSAPGFKNISIHRLTL